MRKNLSESEKLGVMRELTVKNRRIKEEIEILKEDYQKIAEQRDLMIEKFAVKHRGLKRERDY
jgi:hypothetical protein